MTIAAITGTYVLHERTFPCQVENYPLPVFKTTARKIGFLLVSLPVFLVGQAAFGMGPTVAIYLGVVAVQTVVVLILDGRNRQPPPDR
jgi:hypothetical protein